MLHYFIFTEKSKIIKQKKNSEIIGPCVHTYLCDKSWQWVCKYLYLYFMDASGTSHASIITSKTQLENRQSQSRRRQRSI